MDNIVYAQDKGFSDTWTISEMLEKSNDPEGDIKNIVTYVYDFVFPIAVLIAVVKTLINIIILATVQDDPQKLNNVKDEFWAVIAGLIVIGGAVTLINVLGSALGI